MVLKAEREKMVPALQEERQQNRALLEQSYDTAALTILGNPDFTGAEKPQISRPYL